MAAVGENALLAIAGLFALFGGVFPLLRRLSAAQPALAAAGARASAGAAPHPAALGPAATPAQPRVESQNVFSIEAETVQTLVTNDPARTAQVIRGWIAGDRSSAV